MILAIIKFFKGIKLLYVALISIIVLIILANWALDRMKFYKEEVQRAQSNYENLRDLDSLEIASLQFTTKQELEAYLKSNKSLQGLVSRQNIKTKRIQSILYQRQMYIDSLERSTRIITIIDSILVGKNASEPWKDITECLTIEGSLNYKDDSLYVTVNNREFNNEMVVVGGWERKEWSFLGFKTRCFGKKKAVVTVTSKCGDAQTIVIEK